MVRGFLPLVLAVSGLATTLSGCAAEPLLSDRLPSEWGGLPAGAPARPTTPYQYPAVHDMPPPRSTPTMTEQEQVKLEKDLAAIRDRQEAGEAPAKKAAAPPPKGQAATNQQTKNQQLKNQGAKKKPDVIVVPPPGAKTSGAATNP
jgi:hypothetical protein